MVIHFPKQNEFAFASMGRIHICSLSIYINSGKLTILINLYFTLNYISITLYALIPISPPISTALANKFYEEE